MKKERFNELLRASFKSDETEEWLDVHFNRPIGLAFALLWQKLGVTPNTITILSIFLGIAAGVMFYFTDLAHNVAGAILLMLANFCDSTDGQLARLTNQKSLLGRVLDGVSGDIWFFAIYLAFVLRLQHQMIPLIGLRWGIGIWVLAAIAGFLVHIPQSSLSDYYRQIHLYFLLGKEGSELDNSQAQRELADSLPSEKWFDRIFHKFYGNYCKNQEIRTPQFQAFFARYQELKAADPEKAAEISRQLLDGSRPLMPIANILTFNTRAIVLSITAILNCPWVYFLFEIIVLTILYVHMHHTHERMCERLMGEMRNEENEK
ncbi:MAG: CDP-alcohol phosphatidyltransferase family protein [Prevotella sp.]|nr:CDP-alcohol phosphatidyltransferase family protein [Prevotella sp.]